MIERQMGRRAQGQGSKTLLAVLLCGALLSGCGGSGASDKVEAPQTALQKRAALLERPPTALEKDVEKSAETVRQLIAKYGYSLDSEWNVSKEGTHDRACANRELDLEMAGLVTRALQEGDRMSRLRVRRLDAALITCESGYYSDEAHKARSGMALVLLQLGQTLAARALFEDELARVEQRYGKDSEQTTTVLLGRIAALWGGALFSEAYPFFEEHQAAIRKYFPQNYRSTTASFGVFACINGRTSLGLVYAQRLQRLYDPTRHSADGYTLSVAQIATCLKGKGQKVESQRLMRWVLDKQQRAAAASTDPADWTWYQVLNENGLIYEWLGEFSRAEREYKPLLQRALADGIPEKPGYPLTYAVTGWTGLGRAQLEQGKLQEALSTLNELKQIPNEMYVDILRPKVLRGLGKYDQALRSLDVLKERTQGYGEWFRLTSELERARVLWAQGSLAKARDIFQESLAIGLEHLEVKGGGSEGERRRAMENVRLVVDALVSMNLRSGPKDAAMTEEAFSALLITKGVLLDALSADFAKLRQSKFKDDVELLARLHKTRDDLARRSVKEQEGEFFEQRLQLEALESMARERSRALGGDPKPVTPEDVRASLQEGETFVEFVDFGHEDPKQVPTKPVRHIAAYVVKKKGPIRVFDLGTSESISRAVEEARVELQPGTRGADRKLKKLGVLVFGALESALSATHTLRIAPDGALTRIPFAALKDASGKYYLERFVTTYIGTGREWARLAETRTALAARPGSSARVQLSPTIVANPEFGSKGQVAPSSTGPSPFTLSTRGQTSLEPVAQDWQALPGTGKEARKLAALFPKGSVLTRHDATESAVKALKHPDILHIASHGYFLPPTSGDGKEQASEDPLLHAGLVLAFANVGGRGSDDGFLTALEVAGMDLSGTQVATLSACETGLGEINGEGVFGLRRSLAIAGAESQLLSLWKVSDDATLQLMTEFYKRIARGESRQAALTSAQRSMAQGQKYRHPYYWSGFVLSGDPGVLRTKD